MVIFIRVILVEEDNINLLIQFDVYGSRMGYLIFASSLTGMITLAMQGG